MFFHYVGLVNSWSPGVCICLSLSVEMQLDPGLDAGAMSVGRNVEIMGEWPIARMFATSSLGRLLRMIVKKSALSSISPPPHL